MKAFKLLALTSCVLLAAGNGVAQQNYSKSEGLLQYVDPYIGSGYHRDLHSFPTRRSSDLVFRMEWYSWVLPISIKVGTGARVIIIPIVF